MSDVEARQARMLLDIYAKLGVDRQSRALREISRLQALDEKDADHLPMTFVYETRGITLWCRREDPLGLWITTALNAMDIGAPGARHGWLASNDEGDGLDPALRIGELPVSKVTLLPPA